MKKILITGTNGFIGGRAACDLSKNKNIQIILGKNKNRSNVKWKNENEIMEMDYENISNLELACDSIDTVIHCVGMNSQDCQLNPAEAIEINAVYTARLLNSAVKKKVKRFIYISTAHIYSNNLVGSIDEVSYPKNLHPYATSHRAAEDCILYQSELGNIEGIILRLSNSFGVPVHDDVNCWMLLVNDLCKQAVQTKELILRSDGLQSRNFIPLCDVSNILEHLIGINWNLENVILNVGSDWSPTVFEMATMIQDRCKIILGFTPALKRKEPLPGASSIHFDYSIGRLRKTEYKSDFHFTEEIDNLLRYCQEKYSP